METWEDLIKKNGALALLADDYLAATYQEPRDLKPCSSTGTSSTKLKTERRKWTGTPSSKSPKKR